MPDRYVFADEAGNFDFSDGQGASRYFILCTVTSTHCVADYCTWAIQRRWEREDDRSRSLIAPKIRSEFDVWSRGEVYYY